MVEIEEEYKLLEWIKHLQDEYASGVWNKDDDVKFKQILQDHEDAKEFKYWKKQIRDDCNLVEGQEFSRLMGIHYESQLWLKIGKKDRQIVKEIKKVISRTIEEDGFIEPENGLLEIEKILEGKK